MTYEYKKRIDNLLLDLLSHIYLSPENIAVVEQDLRSVIQKEFFLRLVINLPEEDNVAIQACIQENGINHEKTHNELARVFLAIYSRDFMRTILDQSITHIVTTYINITMQALNKEQRHQLEEFQRNLLLSQAT